MLVGLAVSAAVVADTPQARADSCPLIVLVSCGPSGAPTTTTTAVPATATTSTTVPPQPSEEQARGRLVALVNTERLQSGRRAVASRADVVDIASRWSQAMAREGAISHNDGYFSRDTRRRLRARAMGENVARNTTVDGAHRALMASEHHRANILDDRFAVVGFGAVFQDGSWWVTEDFLEPQPLAGAVAPRRPRALAERAKSERATWSTTVARPADAGDVLAASSPHMPAASREQPRIAALAGEDLVNERLTVVVTAVAVVLVGAALALRRVTGHPRDLAAEGSIEDDGLTQVMIEPIVVGSTDDVAGRGLHQRLAVINAWVRTLDDRWSALSESDKRVAMQIIRRNTEAAIHEMPEMMSASG